MSRAPWMSFALAWVPMMGGAAAQVVVAVEAPPTSVVRHERGGDLDKIEWVRPFALAQQRARQQRRLMLVKPILGGSNVAVPAGVPCGGKNDCEGSW